MKSDWFNSRLTTSVSIFRTELDNVGQSTGQTNAQTGNTIYVAKKGVVSRGVEFEVNGALTDNWQMTFGGTSYVAEDANGDRYNSQLPRTSFNLFTSYRLPMLDQLTLGGGVNWQARTYADISGPDGNGTAHPSGQLCAGGSVRALRRDQNLSLQANLNNLFDKEYDENVDSTGIVYGEPRNFMLSAKYRF